MVQGVIIKALSGFYYVAAGDQIVECKARGRFRYDGCSPLVGDRVEVCFDAHGKGRIDTVLAAAQCVHPPGGGRILTSSS